MHNHIAGGRDGSSEDLIRPQHGAGRHREKKRDEDDEKHVDAARSVFGKLNFDDVVEVHAQCVTFFVCGKGA